MSNLVETIGQDIIYNFTKLTGITAEKLPVIGSKFGGGDGFNESTAIIGGGIGALLGIFAFILAKESRRAKDSEIWPSILIPSLFGFLAGGNIENL